MKSWRYCCSIMSWYTEYWESSVECPALILTSVWVLPLRKFFTTGSKQIWGHYFELCWLSRTLLLGNHKGQKSDFPEAVSYRIIYASRVPFTGEFQCFINKLNIEVNNNDTEMKNRIQGNKYFPLKFLRWCWNSTVFIGIWVTLTIKKSNSELGEVK